MTFEPNRRVRRFPARDDPDRAIDGDADAVEARSEVSGRPWDPYGDLGVHSLPHKEKARGNGALGGTLVCRLTYSAGERIVKQRRRFRRGHPNGWLVAAGALGLTRSRPKINLEALTRIQLACCDSPGACGTARDVPRRGHPAAG